MKFLLPLLLLSLTACVGSPAVKKESLSYKASASVNCSIASPTAYSGPISGNLSATLTCSGSTPPPVVCTPPAVNQNGVCVNPTPVVSSTCSTSQLSDTTLKLSRQCSGSITYYGGTVSPYSGSFTELTDVLSSPSYRYGTFMNLYSGVTMIANVNSGSYVSFAITPTSTGSIQLANNQSWGDGGLISLSTKPGQFTLGNPSVICMQNTGAGNSMIFSTVAGSQCQMEVGTTYWVNFADVVLSTGDELCFQRARNSCAGGTSKISYVVYTSKTQ